MKFVVDENLSPRLVAWLSELGHDVVHWRDVSSVDRSDAALAGFSETEGRVIVTKDNDFEKPKRKERVLRLGIGNCSNQEMLAWLEPRLEDAIARFRRGEIYVEIG